MPCGSHVALIAQLGEHCTGIAEVVGSNPAKSLNFFSGLCSSSVTAALALMTVSTQLLLMDKINFHPTILGPRITSTFKGLTRIRPLSCVSLIAQLGEHCTGIAEVVGSNPAQSLNFFQVSVLVVLRTHLH